MLHFSNILLLQYSMQGNFRHG